MKCAGLISLFILSLFAGIVLPQTNDIQAFPFAYDSLSITETSPVFISDNEIILFFCSPRNDSVFISKTSDGGNNWSQPVFIIETDISTVHPAVFLSSLLTPTNRIILAWSAIGVGTFSIYSDDLGLSWSQPVLILGRTLAGASRRNYNLNLSQISPDRIWLSFNFPNNAGLCYYRESTNNGESWGDNTDSTLFIFSTSSTPYLGDVSFVSLSNNDIVAFFQTSSSNEDNIYMRKTSDGGQNWSEGILVTGTDKVEKRPRAIKADDGKIWLVYEREYPTIKTGLKQGDIFYKTSSDNGNTFSEEEKFTKYIGDDSQISISKHSTKPFVSFVTQRYSGTIGNRKIAWGIPGETIEVYTPPVVYDVKIINDNNLTNPLENIINITVQDDDSLKEVFVVLEDSQKIFLYDDGLHFDGEANDFIYGNKFTLIDYPAGAEGYIAVNKIFMPVSPYGSLAAYRNQFSVEYNFTASDLNNYSVEDSRIFITQGNPQGLYDGINYLFSGGFIISGYSNGLLWAAGQASSSLIENFVAGRVNDQSNPKNIVYGVNSSDPPFGDRWHRWKDAVELGANFYDGDGDGIYNPVDLNNNGVWDPDEDMPDLLGDRTVWTVYNDGVPGNQRLRFAGVEPQGIEIQQTVFASALPELEDILFIRYKIINRGTSADVLDSVRLGFWSDPDIGVKYENDVAGSDTLLQSSFIYKGADDDSLGYGSTPPAFYTTLLQGAQTETAPTDTAYIKHGKNLGETVLAGWKNSEINAFVFHQKSDPIRGDPNTAIEARRNHIGQLSNGGYLDPCTDNLGIIGGGVNCSDINPLFQYSGDPVTNNGWLLNSPTDVRAMLSTGPFQLEKDKPVEVIYAYVLGRSTDRLNSITVARDNVQKAIDEYLSNFSSLAYKPGEPSFVVDNYELFQNFPNPFNPSTTIRFDLPEDGIVTIELFDILGQKVRTLLSEFKSANRYDLTFNATGLASGVYIYRMRINEFIASKKMVYLR
ncbi:MAG: exo-alpha-sialidase [Ignavibacterium sp.]|nr:exo-alpha-sialidase [Ignavibacterium sp.]